MDVKKFPLPAILKFPRHEGVGPSEKASLGGQTGGSANKKKRNTLKIQIQFEKLLVQFRSFANERYCLQLKIIVTFRRHAFFS